MDARRVVGGLGRALIGVAVLVLLFVAFQLWGTGVHEARAQHALRRSFTAATRATPTSAPAPLPPLHGAMALLQIPRLGLDKAVVEGVGVADLKKAPGHYPGTALPGQPGNVAIAGHRTTYGAPFYRLDELRPGDAILLRSLHGEFRYEVDGTKVVAPSDIQVLAQGPGAHLTLTTCNPRFSARQRLVVTATLVGPPATTGATTTPRRVASVPADGLSGDRSAAWPTITWGLLAAAVALLTRMTARRWHRLPAYLLGGTVFLVVLYAFYDNVARLLPANV